MSEQREIPESLHGLNFLESIDDGFASFDAEWRFTYVNRNAERLLHRAGESLIGKIFWEEYPALIGTESERVYRAVMEHRVPGQSEEYYAPLNGWFEGRYFPAPDGGIFVLFRDITSRKLAEEALRTGEERLRLAQQAGRVGTWSFDLFDPEKNHWSAETYDVAGMDMSWLPRYSEWLALVHPDDRDAVGKTISTAIESGPNDFAVVYRIKGMDGQERWNEMRGCVRRDAAGTAVAASGVMIDISSRRAADEALRESEIFNRSIVESSRDCIKVLSLDGRLLSINRKGRELLGVTDTSQILHRQWVDFWPEKDRPACLRALQDAREGGVGSFEGAFTTPAGQSLWIHVVVTPIVGGTGAVKQLLAVSRDMTSAKQVETELRESEQRWRSLANALPQFIWVAKSFGDAQFINDYWYEYSGLPYGDLSMSGWQKVLHPADLPRIGEMWQEAQSSGSPRTFEYRARRAADGMWRWHLGFHSPERDANGTIARWIGAAFDIHDRKLAQEALRQTEERQRLAVEAGGVGLWDWDLENNRIHWSDRIYEFYGVEPAAFSGTPEEYFALIHPDDVSRVKSSVADAVNSGQPFRLEFRALRPGGSARWLLTRAQVVTNEHGRASRLIGATLDITERKQAEHERDQLLVREKEARQTAELLNQVGPTLAAELDQQRLVQSVTDIATELVGAEFGSFFHNVVKENGESYMLYTLSGVPKEAFAGFPMPRNTAVFGPTFRGEGIVRSNNIKRDPRYGKSAPYYGMPKGHLPVCSYLAAPVISRSGEVLGGLFFGHSLEGQFSERHEAIVAGIAAQAAIAMDNARLFKQAQWVQDELKRSNQDLRRANQDLETFAYSASHDLQEPLRTISISAQLLERRVGDLSDDAKTFLAGVLEGAGRMQTLIADLLSYTRATKSAAGSPPVISASAVVGDVLQGMQSSIEQAQARVSFGELPAVPIHEVHLRQLFQNLIGNSLKYKSAENPYVQISAVERDGWVIFSVADNGIGVDTRFGEQIFGLFKRLHTHDEYPGSGIGLAICQRIVEQYGGRIWLERSVPGRGSVFSFTLPSRSVQ